MQPVYMSAPHRVSIVAYMFHWQPVVSGNHMSMLTRMIMLTRMTMLTMAHLLMVGHGSPHACLVSK